jgi:hypothetical protein
LALLRGKKQSQLSSCYFFFLAAGFLAAGFLAAGFLAAGFLAGICLLLLEMYHFLKKMY